jgi:hypothetical protein
MNLLGILKRAVPFLAALVVGLFVASFFVDLTPRLGERGRRHKHCRDHRELKMQYLRERERNEQLQQQLDAIRQNPMDLRLTEELKQMDLDVPPPPAPRAR